MTETRARVGTLLLTLGIAVTLSACRDEGGSVTTTAVERPKELDRDSAARILQAHADFAQGSPWTCRADGINWPGGPDAPVAFSGLQPQLTPWGQQFFSTVRGYRNAVHSLTTVAPIKKTLRSVTGITDEGAGANIKTVEFEWEWDQESMPVEVREYCQTDDEIARKIPGKALLRLYDDGWRLIKVDYHVAPPPAT